jgi:hypothetical protein
MRRPFVITSCALAVALAPAALFAQTQPPAQPPTQPPAQQTPPAQPEAPKEPRLSFSGDAGVLLYQIKPDQTAAFEELVGKVKAGLLKSEDPIRKQQAASLKVYKSNEPMGANALYVMIIDPAVKAAEYDLFVLLVESLGKDYATPENQAMVKKYADAFAAGANRLNLTPLNPGGM